MDLFTFMFFAVGLSFDSFAASVSYGMCQPAWSRFRGFRFSLILGFFQGLMPLAGWFIAVKFDTVIDDYDHWIAFILLTFLGCRMIIQSFRRTEGMQNYDHFTIRNNVITGFATSIDAFVAGVAMALLHLDFIDGTQLVNMLFAALVITVITVISALIGLYLGRSSSGKLKNYAGITGGAILVFIGLRVLLEHILG